MSSTVDLLILGAGWTSKFLIQLCQENGLQCAATTRTGKEGTVQFDFDPDSHDSKPYEVLPDARTVLVTFPIKNAGASQRLVRNYQSSRTVNKNTDLQVRFIQLGATNIWDRTMNAEGALQIQGPWCDRHTPHNNTLRATCEDELLALSPHPPTTVLNLAGLWGDQRSPRRWVPRVAPTKDALKNKGSLHLIHGIDVARAILAVHGNFLRAQGKRWILSDNRVYDWWDLAYAWGSPESPGMVPRDPLKDHCSATSLALDKGRDSSGDNPPDWVKELMEEQGIRALPRDVETLGRALDSRDFWKTFKINPVKALLEY
ncbi:hypothetical protein AGABI1DRAFT_75582 [Agaricus bisporus var. burnettii JB137-S8]|uniref:Uncharacterized protein n=1 Tax=Agaricus bisporus var. burnettii (strain JB137-S8 / ATCC MYA-4627 / FGSC 10392) TaxID=597362 RepID=K5X7Q4_AGABU|nr:uncharacterized protein AGABI1DRAFT_75582 [Agaricus bisporus var. burnettii JB137-S8]EKM79012.1 hypothetical protein AGABI1DRAFT_75582 [Agaricus bisporus var. burnettii JB137-S8]